MRTYVSKLLCFRFFRIVEVHKLYKFLVLIFFRFQVFRVSSTDEYSRISIIHKKSSSRVSSFTILEKFFELSFEFQILTSFKYLRVFYEFRVFLPIYVLKNSSQIIEILLCKINIIKFSNQVF